MIALYLFLASRAFAADAPSLTLESCEYKFTKPMMVGTPGPGNPDIEVIGAEVSWTVSSAGAGGAMELHSTFGHVGRNYSDPKNPQGMGSAGDGRHSIDLESGARVVVTEDRPDFSSIWAGCGDKFYVEISPTKLDLSKEQVWLGAFDCRNGTSETKLRKRCTVTRPAK